MIRVASGVALWRRSGSGKGFGGGCLNRGGDFRSVPVLRRSWVGAGLVFRRVAICRQRSFCRLLWVSRLWTVEWQWSVSRSLEDVEPSGAPFLLGFRSGTPATFWYGWLCTVSVLWRWDSVQRRGNARWGDGEECGHRRQPWWIVILLWWFAALKDCGEWGLGRVAVVFGPGVLGLVLSLVLCDLCFLAGCSIKVVCLFPVVVLLTISPSSFERGLGLAVLSGCQHDGDSPLHGVWQFWITVSERVNRFIFLLVAGLYRYSWVWMFLEVASRIWLELAVLSGCQLDGDSPLHGVWQFWITVFERVNRFIFLLVAGLYRFCWIWLFLGVVSQVWMLSNVACGRKIWLGVWPFWLMDVICFDCPVTGSSTMVSMRCNMLSCNMFGY